MTALCMIIILNSCASQIQIARNKVFTVHPPAVLVMFPDNLYKDNLYTDLIKGYDKMSSDDKDSARFFSSRFIQYIDDSVLIQSYYQSLVSELQRLGFRVYTEDKLDSFLLFKGKSWMFSLAQLSMEETKRPYSDSEEYDDSLFYSRRFDLNVVSLNSWFEVSEANTESGKLKVLFSTHTASDVVKGRFRRHPLLMEVTYKYTIKEVKMQDMYGLADFSGRKNAAWLYDYWMNDYLKSLSQPPLDPKTYWHFDFDRQKITPAGDDRFIQIDEAVKKD